MATPSGLLRSTRALFAAAKSATPVANISPSATKVASSSAASKTPKIPKERKPPSNSGVTRTTPISVTLQSLVGAPEASRAQVVKKVWEHIKLHNLQNPSNKKEILCDAKLKKLFDGKDKVGFLEIGKLLTPHFIKSG
ncbi:SWIB/MDM2 domain superfamily protein [Striga hermonthica]|uniref:SWIB/MDM2 domain superfamily protein n=1 Tax=Striga hermonthica TaxID=68872 RepID=A0A9N7N8S1_STRHE|nr:SWIB/MDM2 domain superfamily protein [Striga hermonthica]